MDLNPLSAALQERRRRGDTVVNLINTNFHDCGLFFPRDRLRSFLAGYADRQHYRPDPRGEPALRRVIAAYYGGNPDDLIVTASTSDAYNLLFSVLCSPGDNVLFPSPGYPLFEYLARYHGLESRFYRLEFDHAFTLRPEAVATQLDENTRFLVLISPNNPTGRVYTPEEIRRVGAVAAEQGVPIICDEVFSEYLYTAGGATAEAATLPRPLEELPEQTVITLNGISKLLALPDLKLGWILVTGPDAERRRLLGELELANDMFLNASGPAGHVTTLALPEREAFLAGARRHLQEARERLLGVASAIPELELVPPEGGIHAVLRLPRGLPLTDEAFALALLEEWGVYLHPGYLYGFEDNRCLVISLLPGAEVVERGVAAVRELLRRH